MWRLSSKLLFVDPVRELLWLERDLANASHNPVPHMKSNGSVSHVPHAGSLLQIVIEPFFSTYNIILNCGSAHKSR